MKKISTLLICCLLISCSSTKKGIHETATTEQPLTSNIDNLKLEVQKNPNNPQALFQLGLAYADFDSTDIAIMYFDSALYFNADYIPALYEKANLLIDKNRIKEGYVHFLDVLKSDQAEDYLAEIAVKIGNPYPIHQLTNGDYNNAYGYYSPGGKKIAFQSDRDGNWDVFLIDSEGLQDVKITKNSSQEEMPVFSYDGKGIAYTSTRGDSNHFDRVDMTRDIYYLDLEGNNEARLVESPYDDWYPCFTNKISEFVFVSELNDPREVNFDQRLSDIYIKELKDGTTLRLTQNEADDGSPCASRNGKWIVFTSNRTGTFQIHRMDKKGNMVEQLTFLEGHCGAPHFSHNSKQIAFFAEVNENYDIYLMTASGDKITRLTSDPAQDAYPCFSPDGKRILFHSNRTGKFHLFWIDLMNPFKQEELVKQIEERIASME